LGRVDHSHKQEANQREFNALGIDFVSLNESVDTSTPMRKLMFTVIGAMAELERSLIRERGVMGLEQNARARNSDGQRNS
jgi:DNA invertase Pin-like site-specific DNA recombinase